MLHQMVPDDPSGRLATMSTSLDLHALLGEDADALLGHTAKAFPSENLVLPGPDYLSRVFTDSDRSPTVLRNLGSLFNHGRLGGTGYVSILPVDQGIEHSAAASFSKNPAYFDPLNIIELALAGECNAVATTLGTLGLASRKYVHRIPFIVKLNHNAFLHVAQHLRPDHVRLGEPGIRPRCGRGGRDDLLRLRRHGPRAPAGVGGLRRGPPARHVHRAVVLPAQPGLHEGRGQLPRSRRTSPARPTTWA